MLIQCKCTAITRTTRKTLRTLILHVVKKSGGVPRSGEECSTLHGEGDIVRHVGRITIWELERLVKLRPVVANRPIPNSGHPYTGPSAFAWGP